jgi:xylulokinase
MIRLTSNIDDLQAIKGIAISGQSPTLVILDKAGNPVRDAIIWMDSRAEVEAQEIAKIDGRYRPPTYNGPKLLWIRKHEPKIYSKIGWIQSPTGFVSSKLIDDQVTDISDQEFYDYSKDTMNTTLLSKLNIPRDWFPRSVHTGQVMGYTVKPISEKLGIPMNTPIVAAPFDGMMSVYGVGVVNLGECGLVLGTSTGLGLITTVHPPTESKIFVARHFSQKDWLLVGGVMTMGGAAYDWFVENIWIPDESANPKEWNRKMDTAVESVPPGSGGLIFLPYLIGERSPIWDEMARGLYFGLTAKHTRPHLLRALMEGVAFGIKHNLDVMTDYGALAHEFRVTGGIGKSITWTQIIANVLGKQIHIPRYLDSETLGDAMLVAVSQGIYKNHSEAAEKMVQITRTVEPDMKLHELYMDLYKIYRDLYVALKDLYQERYDLVNRWNLEEDTPAH